MALATSVTASSTNEVNGNV